LWFQLQKADTTTTAATKTGIGEETRASTEIVLHETVSHHHLAEAAMPTETETAKATALQAMTVEAKVAVAVAVAALVMTEIRVWGDHRARRSLWKDLRHI
jgi:hypothetical protein